eukprot:GEMP01036215.1.p1 GENE.GEMP01036215.1~~GEMP01036215.1.p1  ORF type:complete len:375 (+),score=81.42 GEMP01036215.1:44-1168(+)
MDLSREDGAGDGAEAFVFEILVHSAVFYETSRPQYVNLFQRARALLAVNLLNMPQVVIEAPDNGPRVASSSSTIVSRLVDPTVTFSILCRTKDEETYLLASCALDLSEELHRAAHQSGGPLTNLERFKPMSLNMTPVTVTDVPVSLNCHIRLCRTGPAPDLEPIVHLPHSPVVLSNAPVETVDAEVQVDAPAEQAVLRRSQSLKHLLKEMVVMDSDVEFCPPAFTITGDGDVEEINEVISNHRNGNPSSFRDEDPHPKETDAETPTSSPTPRPTASRRPPTLGLRTKRTTWENASSGRCTGSASLPKNAVRPPSRTTRAVARGFAAEPRGRSASSQREEIDEREAAVDNQRVADAYELLREIQIDLRELAKRTP